jgi:hypothetical protein
MMKNIIIIGLIVIFFISSCRKDNTSKSEATGTIEFNLAIPTLQKSTIDSSLAVYYALVSIRNDEGNLTYNCEIVPIYSFGNSLISKSISLKTGDYNLEKFIILDCNGKAIYATPTKNSNLAYLVKAPLPVSFTINKDIVQQISPEVIAVNDTNALDFGYASFSFNLVKTFNFKIASYIYSDSIKDNILTESKLCITADSFQYTTNLLAKTNIVTIPEKNVRYNLSISKTGYKNVLLNLSKDSLKLYTTIPLAIHLVPNLTDTSLIAYYPFNGDVLDYSGYNNHGIYYGRGYFCGPRNPLLSVAGSINLNGTTDYVEVKSTPLVTKMNKVTVTAWYCPVPFSRNTEINAIVSRMNQALNSIPYQFALYVTDTSYNQNKAGFGFVAFHTVINTTGTGYGANCNYKLFQYKPNNWYFLAGTHDGDTARLYVNGELMAKRAAKGVASYTNSNLNIYIGTDDLSKRTTNPLYTPGRIDEIRIYDRTLSNAEIKALYLK